MTVHQAETPGIAADHDAPSDPGTTPSTTADAAPALDLMGRLIRRHAAPAAGIDYGGIVVARLLGMLDGGRSPLVVLPEPAGASGLRARSIVDLHRPIVMGVLRHDDDDPATPAPLEVRYDGGRVLLEADTELVLRCGLSRITLRRDGHVEVQGETILTRASGANRLQGGSVQLN